MAVRSAQLASPLRASSLQQLGADTTIELYNENTVTTITFGGGSGLTAVNIGSPGSVLSLTDVVDIVGRATSPGVAPAGTARYYFDTNTNTLQVSQSGGAYGDFVGGGGGGSLSSVLATGNTTGANNIVITSGQRLEGAAELTLAATGANPVDLRTNSTTRVRIESGGAVQLGDPAVTATPANTALYIPRDTDDYIRLRTSLASGATSGQTIVYQRSRGTNASPAATSSGDLVGGLTAQPYVGAGTMFAPAARVDFYVDGAPSDTSAPGRIVFLTTPAASVTPVERARITNLGTLIYGDGTATTNLTGAAGAAQTLYIGYRDNNQALFHVCNFDSTATNGAVYSGIRGRGTAAAPAAVQSGDLLLRFIGQGWANGTTIAPGGEFHVEADGAWSVGNTPNRLSFWTTPSGSGTAVERVRINNLGTTFFGDGVPITAFGGAGAASTAVHVHRNSTASIVVDSYTAASALDSAYIILRRSRGSAASPAVPISGDTLGAISVQGATTGTDTREFGRLAVEVDGTVGGVNDAPGRITLWTTLDGAGTPTERFRIDNAGRSTAFGWIGCTSATIADYYTLLTTGGYTTNNTLTMKVSTNGVGERNIQFSDTAGTGANYQGARWRGSITSPAAVQVGDLLFSLTARGSTAANLVNDLEGGAIRFEVDSGTVGGASLPSRITFLTTPDGSNTSVERLRLTNQGLLHAGNGTLTTTAVFGGSDPSTSLLAYRNGSSIIQQNAFSASDVTNFWYSLRARGTAAAPAAAANNDRVAAFMGAIATSGSTTSAIAAVAIAVDGVPAVGDAPGRIIFQTTPAGSSTLVERWRISNAGNFLAGTDNAYDIGAAAATRPRDLHLGRYLRVAGEYQPIILSKTSVNLASVAATNLYTVPAGLSLVVTDVIVRPTTATAANGDAVAGVGVAAGEDDIFASQPLTGLDATTERYKFLSSGVSYVAQATEIVKFGVDTADTGTALVADVYLIGYLI